MEIDLVELIAAGATSVYPDKRERFAALFEASYCLTRGFGGLLRDHLSEFHRRDILAEGMCPYCGREVTTRTTREQHPYGSTTATETMTRVTCPNCGEV